MTLDGFLDRARVKPRDRAQRFDLPLRFEQPAFERFGLIAIVT